MKRTLLFIACVLTSITMLADETKINEQNFPDENFRNYVLSTAVDKNKNRILDDDEILRVTNIDVHQKKIESLKGIEYFTELQILTCYQNNLTELDLSACTKLDTLNCSWNRLTSLNLSGCAKLEWICCDQNQLSELDVSASTELKLLICSGNKIKALDVMACMKLDYFNCQGNNLTKLDVSNNTALVTLYCDMNHLKELDMSNNTKLEECSCSGNEMTKLILSKDNVLNSLNCCTNQLYGEAMDHIVENLNYQEHAGFLAVFDAENKELERNVITTKQVDALNAKGWKVYQWIHSGYSLYKGIYIPDDYRPFVEEGKVWKVGDVISGSPVQLVEYYYFDGDTIIGGKTCKQMMCQRYISPDYPGYDNYSQRPSLNYVGAWYEENKQVYTYDTKSKQFKMMYDFSIDANDTLQIGHYSYVIGPRTTGGIKGFKGVYREVRECREVWDGGDGVISFRCAPWLEGVGIVYGPPTLNVLNVELADPMWFLMSCTVGDEVIYLNDEYEDGATPESMGARKRFDFSHTIKTKPKARNRSEENLSLYGEYNDQQLGINLNPLDDAYLVSISDETGKVVYEKSVNAGNIVGLNIDISAYAKGHYTITVENSDEIFTGEFDAQATEIRDVRWKKEDGRSIIYNLQGQRLYSLQKGLNIVNGQKVFVK